MISAKSHQYNLHTLWFKIFFEIALASSVSEINPFFTFYAEIQDGRQKWQKNTEIQDGRQNFNKIALAERRSISEINMFLLFVQKFKN